MKEEKLVTHLLSFLFPTEADKSPFSRRYLHRSEEEEETEGTKKSKGKCLGVAQLPCLEGRRREEKEEEEGSLELFLRQLLVLLQSALLDSQGGEEERKSEGKRKEEERRST